MISPAPDTDRAQAALEGFRDLLQRLCDSGFIGRLARLTRLERAARHFVRKVESGRASSTESYRQFKVALGDFDSDNVSEADGLRDLARDVLSHYPAQFGESPFPVPAQIDPFSMPTSATPAKRSGCGQGSFRPLDAEPKVGDRVRIGPAPAYWPVGPHWIDDMQALVGQEGQIVNIYESTDSSGREYTAYDIVADKLDTTDWSYLREWFTLL